ncbi:hypothetical protein PHYBLDRAFT_138854 [Phycomyces blakesleeanus NRRL 1555(-)]|uniref:Uncharacterized protein n=1 Tax=Phycomyces blakesleeanus (strain ATCC 8743b / DSM 1359 / FGSC 10004 / NBRC 33097 / NRRL 1555) TaxID=763407 RepID=A0A167RBX3_PHYB8|nr:hypothetical protein PHYBLDRAFT_138854 [Phycomyces blakesleeanus NRRL 1555(-)]OAD81309.1 hypothetical protein PHYBLDRAFT_138854 [Phycomyces blakesleeanus NRRL 1555(-)]|eukprot:XP_018299349.1 hypothetical protein PHYBLDRAFT_138854 [Phycomyces blakesleeanus NRRL 1555(-)]
MTILYFFEGTSFCPEGFEKDAGLRTNTIKLLIMSDIAYFQAVQTVQAVPPI